MAQSDHPNQTETFANKVEETLRGFTELLFRFLFTVWKATFASSSFDSGANGLLKDKRVLAPITFVVISLLSAVLFAKYIAAANPTASTLGENINGLLASLEKTSETAILFWLIPLFVILSILMRFAGWIAHKCIGIELRRFEQVAGYSMGIQFTMCAVLFACSSWVLDFFVGLLLNHGFSIFRLFVKTFLIVVFLLFFLGTVALPALRLARGLKRVQESKKLLRRLVIELGSMGFHTVTLLLVWGTWHMQFQTLVASAEISRNSIGFLCVQITEKPVGAGKSIHLEGALTSDSAETLILPKDSFRLRVAWRKKEELTDEATDAGFTGKGDTNSIYRSLKPGKLESTDASSPLVALKKDDLQWCVMDFHLGGENAEFSNADLRELSLRLQFTAISEKSGQTVSRGFRILETGPAVREDIIPEP